MLSLLSLLLLIRHLPSNINIIGIHVDNPYIGVAMSNNSIPDSLATRSGYVSFKPIDGFHRIWTHTNSSFPRGRVDIVVITFVCTIYLWQLTSGNLFPNNQW